jgi:MFS family permease
VPKAPIKQAVSESGPDMLRVFCMSLMNVVPTTVNTFGATFATNAAYGNGFTTTTYLWISVVGNIVAVVLIPFVGNLTDRIGRRPCMIVGALGSGVMGYLYLYAVDTSNTTLAFISAMLMWGVVYQGYNATFPAFYQELFPTRTRVTAFAVSQNLGTMATAFLPAVFATVAPPGSNVPLIVGSIVLGIAIIAAARGVHRARDLPLHMNDLGVRGHQPVPLRGVQPHPSRGHGLLTRAERRVVPNGGRPGRSPQAEPAVCGHPHRGVDLAVALVAPIRCTTSKNTRPPRTSV